MNAPSARLAMIALMVGLFLTGTVIAASIAQFSISPLDIGSSEVVNSESIIIESQQLAYSGTDISGASIVVNNTGGSNVSGDVSITLKAANGSMVARQTKTSVQFASDTTTTVTFSFSSSIHPESFFWINVTVVNSG